MPYMYPSKRSKCRISARVSSSQARLIVTFLNRMKRQGGRSGVILRFSKTICGSLRREIGDMLTPRRFLDVVGRINAYILQKKISPALILNFKPRSKPPPPLSDPLSALPEAPLISENEQRNTAISEFACYPECSVSSEPLSMSRRRLASKIPMLNSRVPLPPVPNIWTSADSCRSTIKFHTIVNKSSGPTTSRTLPLSALRLQKCDPTPITPVDQIVHGLHTPPDAPGPKVSTYSFQHFLKPDILSAPLREVALPCSPSSRLDRPLINTASNLSPATTTMVELPATQSLTGLTRGIQYQQVESTNLKTRLIMSCVYPSSPSVTPPVSHARPKLLSNIPRRLSYNYSLPFTSSPPRLIPHRNILLAAKPQSLASPVILRNALPPQDSPGLSNSHIAPEVSNKVRPTPSSAIASSPSYFNL